MFLTPWFAVAGLIAAAGPVLIHLLNRQRYKTRQWAAMEFLRQAIFRSRRAVQLRDLLLLALRTFCILAFGAAMAQPFFGSSQGEVGSSQPVHAVLLIDNSLSMGYVVGQEIEGQQQRDRTLLDEAKDRAREVIDGLPPDSRISVVPTCGPASGYSNDAYFTKDEALDALETVEPVDQDTRPHETIDRALQACGRVEDPAAKRIVLLTDRQVADWPVQSLAARIEELPAPIDVVQVEPKGPVDNAWISDFQIQDGVADLHNPTIFLARIRYEGPETKSDVDVTLSVNGETIETRTVDLQSGSGSGSEIRFEPFLFSRADFEMLEDSERSQGRTATATARVSISAGRGGSLDALKADDERFLAVPIVATLPVVFIDQLGDDEDPSRDRFGETYRLRQYLAPKTDPSQGKRQVIDLKTRRIEQLDRSLLEDARLVVIAGVETPGSGEKVELLREYVEQGGNLVIAAGGDFDPAQWDEAAWLDGLGILPTSLAPQTVGQPLGSTSGDVFQLDYNSLKSHDYFLLDEPEGFLRKMYRGPIFSKVVEALDDDRLKEVMTARTREQLQQRRDQIEEIDRRMAELRQLESQRKSSAGDRDEWATLETQRNQLEPSWLLWSDPAESEADAGPIEQRAIEQRAEETGFLVVARYDNGWPFLVERRIGRGKVLLVTSGVYPSWNTFTLMNSVMVFDRVFREMLRSTLPVRNVSSQRAFVLPVSAAERTAQVTLDGPGHSEEPLSVDAVGANRYGITIAGVTQRGLYRVTAKRGEESSTEGLGTTMWTIPLAVNGPADESQLLTAEEIEQRAGRGQADVVTETGAVFSLGNFRQARLHGAKSWKWIAGAVLACLLLELVILTRAARSGERTA